jgi:hypothetical protein
MSSDTFWLNVCRRHELKMALDIDGVLAAGACEEGDEVPKSEIAYGYKLKGHEYLVLDKNEIDSAKPVSNKLTELDKFVNFFQVDPHYFERTWLLIPNNSEKPYAGSCQIIRYKTFLI